MTTTSFRCDACGAVNTTNDNAPTHVRITTLDDEEVVGTFQLGNFHQQSKKIGCIKDGLVHRVCHFDSSIGAGSAVLTSGERLFFFRA